jgi:hypothetical protein
MKRVLVTGADCFIGSHWIELSQYNSFNHWGWLDDVDCLPDIEVLDGDVRDSHYCQYITKDVDAVFHLAVLIAIPYSYVAPESYKAARAPRILPCLRYPRRSAIDHRPVHAPRQPCQVQGEHLQRVSPQCSTP